MQISQLCGNETNLKFYSANHMQNVYDCFESFLLDTAQRNAARNHNHNTNMMGQLLNLQVRFEYLIISKKISI